MVSSVASFQLLNGIEEQQNRQPKWGFPVAGGVSLGELTYLRTYSRKKEDGSKERWHDTIRRVVEGCYDIQREHAMHYRIPWSDSKAARSANEMYDLIYDFKFTPPGRGLWMMGTEFVHSERNSAPLYNCSFVSTLPSFIESACYLMDASMLGIGVGFDTAASGHFTIQDPDPNGEWRIPDSREGWVDSVRMLLTSYLEGTPVPLFDYSLIRKAGEPIKRFGGTASGPQALKDLHRDLAGIFMNRKGQAVTQRDVVDVMNLIGRCVVAGNVRRTAEIALSPYTQEFIDLKNYELNPERAAWGWTSNNSLYAKVGETPYENFVERISSNGEPGLFYLDLARTYGRLADAPNFRDARALGTNPCSEITLESFELCNLVETFPTNHVNQEEFARTLKFAYLFGKSVTLLPTQWEQTNSIQLRNRRIGTSMSGIFQFAEQRGWSVLREWMDAGYKELERRDLQYSEWLTIRPSIKLSSVKPSGSVSLLAGVTPGVHAPVAGTCIRRIQFSENDPILGACEDAGFHVEKSVYSAGTYVVEFPVQGPKVRTETEVSIWEKTALAVLAQRYWADNQVSCTVTFDREREGSQIANLLRSYEGQLKSISFLPIDKTAYEQMPYEAISDEDYAKMTRHIKDVDLREAYGDGIDAIGEKYCANDVCEIPVRA